MARDQPLSGFHILPFIRLHPPPHPHLSETSSSRGHNHDRPKCREKLALRLWGKRNRLHQTFTIDTLGIIVFPAYVGTTEWAGGTDHPILSA